MKKIILWNVVILVVLMLIFLVVGFALGYTGRFGTDAGILFLLILAIHLFLNYIIVHRQKDLPPRTILYSNIAIVAIYLLILFH